MMRLPQSLAAWGTAAFGPVLKQEIADLPADTLPLQQGLRHGSYAIGRVDGVTLLSMNASPDSILVRAGLHYAGIIAGCSCADDPTPNNETIEYCEVQIEIDRNSADARVSLLPDT